MGKKLLGVDVPKLLKQSMGGLLLAVTFTKVTAGTRDPNNPGKGTNPTSTVYSTGIRGFVASYAVTSQDGVRSKARVVAVLGASLPAGVIPAPNDKLQVPDDPHCGSEVMIIVDKGVDRDPTGALFMCTVKA
jgi:hypothetical protein